MTGKLLGATILCLLTLFTVPSLAVEIPTELKLRKMGITEHSVQIIALQRLDLL